MEIEELLKEKGKLESDIGTAISAIVSRFKDKTKLSPSSISIFMLEVTTMGESEPQYMIGSVEVHFTFFSTR